MDKTKNLSTVTSMEPPSERPRRLVYTQIIQNFLVIWLDESIDEINHEHDHNSLTKLQQVVNVINIFTNVDECIDFITDIKDENIFMIVSAALSQIIAPIAQDIVQVTNVYIFCENAAGYEQMIHQWPKMKGVFTDITSICQVFKQVARACDQNSINISFIKSGEEVSKKNLDELDQSFMYSQVLKEILITIDFEKEHINEFLTYCREEPICNTIALKHVEKFVEEYHHHPPIWWYTSQGFLYSMLNKALRTMEVDLIIKLGFFLRDLHQNITTLHSEQYADGNHTNSFIVYRGQGLSQTYFNQLMKIEGGLISFNNFLSTSLDRAVSVMFAETNLFDSDLIGVLFKININPSISSASFANIRDVSAYKTEEEIVFSMHSVFRIGKMRQIDENNRIWQVELTLTSDNDPQLHALTEYIREETSSEYNGWHRLGKLLIKLGNSKRAEKLYEILLKQTTSEIETACLFQQLGQTKFLQGEYKETITFYEKSHEIQQKSLSPDHPDVTAYHNNIGSAYDEMGEYSKALSYYEKALTIDQKTFPPDHPRFATSHSNIGSVYNKMGEYSKALSCYEKALEIDQKTLPPNHPRFATSYNNIGLVYDKMGEYSKALLCHEKALEIRQKTLPPDHPDVAISHQNIGSVYHEMGKYSKALLYYEKVLEIRQKILRPDHPDVATSHNNIGSVYNEMGEYSKALLFHEKALEIRQKTLPPGHPDVAISHQNIGSVYNETGKYLKAISYYEKALEIDQKTLPPNHPRFATSYNNIGSVYNKMGEYSKALSYFEKALHIEQKTLPPNHPDIAGSHNDIGSVYGKMSEYSKALVCYEKALEIFRKTLPPDHPRVATSHNNIGSVYDKMGEYSKALSCNEKALEIFQKTLPPDHPDMAIFHNNIGLVYYEMDEYSKALLSYEKALEICQKTLPPDHPNVATFHKNIGSLYYKMGEYSKALSYFEKVL